MGQDANIPAQMLSESPMSDVPLGSVSSSIWEKAGARPPEAPGTSFTFHFVN